MTSVTLLRADILEDGSLAVSFSNGSEFIYAAKDLLTAVPAMSIPTEAELLAHEFASMRMAAHEAEPQIWEGWQVLAKLEIS